jgi:hypothetical protein
MSLAKINTPLKTTQPSHTAANAATSKPLRPKGGLAGALLGRPSSCPHRTRHRPPTLTIQQSRRRSYRMPRLGWGGSRQWPQRLGLYNIELAKRHISCAGRRAASAHADEYNASFTFAFIVSFLWFGGQGCVYCARHPRLAGERDNNGAHDTLSTALPLALALTLTQWIEEMRDICGPTILTFLVGCKADLPYRGRLCSLCLS